VSNINTSDGLEGWHWELPIGGSRIIQITILGSAAEMMSDQMDLVLAALPTTQESLLSVDISALDTAEKRLNKFVVDLSEIVALLKYYLPINP